MKQLRGNENQGEDLCLDGDNLYGGQEGEKKESVTGRRGGQWKII